MNEPLFINKIINLLKSMIFISSGIFFQGFIYL